MCLYLILRVFKSLLETKSTANGVAKYPGATVLGASEDEDQMGRVRCKLPHKDLP